MTTVHPDCCYPIEYGVCHKPSCYYVNGNTDCDYLMPVVEESPAQSSTSTESPAQTQDSVIAPQTKRKRKAKDGESTEAKDSRLEKTFIYSTEDETSVLPEYIKCASCKKAQLISQFIVSRDNTWVVNKSCMACCAKGLSHYDKKKRQKKITEPVVTYCLHEPGGLKTTQAPQEDIIPRWLCDACDPWGSCGRQDCRYTPKRTDLIRKQRTEQGAKRKVPMEFDYLYELEQ